MDEYYMEWEDLYGDMDPNHPDYVTCEDYVEDRLSSAIDQAMDSLDMER